MASLLSSPIAVSLAVAAAWLAQTAARDEPKVVRASSAFAFPLTSNAQNIAHRPKPNKPPTRVRLEA